MLGNDLSLLWKIFYEVIYKQNYRHASATWSPVVEANFHAS